MSNIVHITPQAKVALLEAENRVMLEALQAIVARIQGEYDHPALVKYGPLNTNIVVDALAIAEQAIGRKDRTL